MTVIEIETFHPIERDKQSPSYGLIDPSRIEEYLTPIESEEQLLQVTVGFDDLFDRTTEVNDYGIIIFRGQKLLLDRYIESGNIIRSILVPKVSDNSDNVLRTVLSVIERPDGSLLSEIHHSEHVSDRGITEPPVGGRDVIPFDAEDTAVFAKVTAEALPHGRRSKLESQPNAVCSRGLIRAAAAYRTNLFKEN